MCHVCEDDWKGWTQTYKTKSEGMLPSVSVTMTSLIVVCETLMSDSVENE